MQPLAYRIRPTSFDTFVGQEHLVGTSGPVRVLIETKNIPSMIFWGPPGTGKTTLAEIIANSTDSDFHKLSAVTEGKDSLKRIIQVAKLNEKASKRTIIFIDEIHRWNKAQQDALLSFVESGTITLIGATTENPSFSVISPLLSRSRVFVFKEHTIEDIIKVIKSGAKELGITGDLKVFKYLAELSNGDLRFALNSLEIAAQIATNKQLTTEIIESSTQKFLRYDKKGDEHYNIISAIHKSLRSSNASAAVYWVCRMLAAGEDPLYLARRLVRFASEDIGNAQPNALLLANIVFDTCKNIGMPECGVALVQLTEYLAKAPKNNSAYTAYTKAMEDIKKFGNLPVPLHIRNAPTKLMKDLGYSKGYEYDHDLATKKSNQECFPDELIGSNYFE